MILLIGICVGMALTMYVHVVGPLLMEAWAEMLMAHKLRVCVLPTPIAYEHRSSRQCAISTVVLTQGD